MNLNESFRDWINFNLKDYPSLRDINLVTMGETEDLNPPFFAIYETSSSMVEQNGVVLYGVTEFELTCELHTVPVEDNEGGTDAETERQYRRDFYDIVGDRMAINWMSGRNSWTIFDIRLSSPTTEPNEGRRISRFTITVIASPI